MGHSRSSPAAGSATAFRSLAILRAFDSAGLAQRTGLFITLTPLGMELLNAITARIQNAAA